MGRYVIPNSKAGRIIRAIYRSPIFMAKFFWGKSSYFFLDFPAIHYYIIEKIKRSLKQITIIGIPRGGAKTKLVSTLFGLWEIFTKKRNYAVIVCYSQQKSQEILMDIIHLMNTDRFKEIFPWVKGMTWRVSMPACTVEFIIRNPRTLKPERTVKIKACSIFMELFGASAGEARPDLYIWDDLEDPEKAMNPAQVDKLERWINKTALPGLSRLDRRGRRGKVLWSGTPHAPGCIFERAISKKWRKNVDVIKIPAIFEEKYISQKKLNAINHVAKINKCPELKFNESFWEEMFPIQSLIELREDYTRKGRLSDFLLNYMMDSTMDKPLKFDPTKNIFIDMKELADRLPRAKTIVAIFDMAYTKETYSDYVGINVTAHFANSEMIILIGDKQKLSQVEVYDYCRKLRDRFMPFLMSERFAMYCESKQFDLIQSYFSERNIREHDNVEVFRIQESTQMSKVNRIVRLIPYHSSGYIKYVEEETYPLISEMAMWEPSVSAAASRTKRRGVDDALDANAYQVDFAYESKAQESKEEKYPHGIPKTCRDEINRYKAHQEKTKDNQSMDEWNRHFDGI